MDPIPKVGPPLGRVARNRFNQACRLTTRTTFKNTSTAAFTEGHGLFAACQDVVLGEPRVEFIRPTASRQPRDARAFSRAPASDGG